MEAYVLMDNNTRRKMDEMLKTWKEPVPGSIDTRPVFPPDVTRPIETALIKARTAAVQTHQAQQHLRSQQQILSRGRPSPVPYRDTPTPPNTMRQPQQAPSYPPYGQQQYSTPVNGQQYGQGNGDQPYGLPQVCVQSSQLVLLQLNKESAQRVNTLHQLAPQIGSSLSLRDTVHKRLA